MFFYNYTNGMPTFLFIFAEYNHLRIKDLVVPDSFLDIMCRKGTKLDFLDEMRDDLMRNFREVLSKDKTGMGVNELCEETVKRPARRFYVSSLQAYKIVSKLRKGNFRCLERMPPYRKEMFIEINRMVEECIIKYEYATKPLIFVVAHVLSNRAPRFYISAESMRKLYYSHQKKKRCIKDCLSY